MRVRRILSNHLASYPLCNELQGTGNVHDSQFFYNAADYLFSHLEEFWGVQCRKISQKIVRVSTKHSGACCANVPREVLIEVELGD